MTTPKLPDFFLALIEAYQAHVHADTFDLTDDPASREEYHKRLRRQFVECVTLMNYTREHYDEIVAELTKLVDFPP